MASPAGISGQVGYKSETTWSVGVTVDKFYAGLRSETIKNDGGKRIPSQGIRAGRTVTAQHARGAPIIGGPMVWEMGNNTVAPLLRHCFGAVSTSGAGPYVHTFTPGDLSTQSFSLQVGRPDTGGTVRPVNFAGVKIPECEIAATAGEIALLTTTVSCALEYGNRSVADGVTTNASKAITSATAAFSRADIGTPIAGTGIPAGAYIASVTSATAATLSANATASGTGVTFTIGAALATASYASSWTPFSYSQGAVTANGVSVTVDSFSIKVKNNLRTDRVAISGLGITKQLANGMRDITIDLVMDFEDLTMYNAFLADTAETLVLSLTAGTESLVITAKGFLTGESPTIAGPQILKMPVQFVIESAVSDADAFTAVLTSIVDTVAT